MWSRCWPWHWASDSWPRLSSPTDFHDSSACWKPSRAQPMREMTLSELSRLDAAASEADEAFQMDEDAFRLFYERTARPVWAYLARMTGDARQADDLLQEAYYRLLRAKAPYDSDAHRRNYLFRIATNLVHDIRRRPRVDAVPMSDEMEHADPRQTDAAAH